jgi:CheY-like chemotaxis protein
MLNFLIVEDNRAMRSLIKSIISGLARDVTECADGAGALSAYAECRPDWVFMDIKMKEMNGISATRQIKAAFPDAISSSLPIMTMPTWGSCRERRCLRVCNERESA